MKLLITLQMQSYLKAKIKTKHVPLLLNSFEIDVFVNLLS